LNTVIELEDHRANRNDIAFFREELRDATTCRCGKLAIGLVRGDFGNGLVLDDNVAFFDQPLGDRSLRHALAKLRHRYIDHVVAAKLPQNVTILEGKPRKKTRCSRPYFECHSQIVSYDRASGNSCDGCSVSERLLAT
jgi:hypothetical protein